MLNPGEIKPEVKDINSGFHLGLIIHILEKMKTRIVALTPPSTEESIPPPRSDTENIPSPALDSPETNTEVTGQRQDVKRPEVGKEKEINYTYVFVSRVSVRCCSRRSSFLQQT